MDMRFEVGDFRNLSSTGSNGWKERLKEEKEKLQLLKDRTWQEGKNFCLVKAQFDLLNERLLYCVLRILDGKEKAPSYVSFYLRLPLRYPHSPPKASDFSKEEFISKHHDYKRWDNGDPGFKGFKFACLGKLEGAWDASGKMGIAHYLLMLSYYVALDHFAIIL